MKVRLLLVLPIILFTLSINSAEGFDSKERPCKYYEIRAGILAHDVDNLWSNSNREQGVDLSTELILKRPCFQFLSGTVHPNMGFSINASGYTSSLYAGLLWGHEIEYHFIFNIGVGAAMHSGNLEATDDDQKALGSRILFRIPIEIGYKFNGRNRLYLSFAHLSNAYLASPNEGLDTLGLRYGYSF